MTVSSWKTDYTVLFQSRSTLSIIQSYCSPVLGEVFCFCMAAFLPKLPAVTPDFSIASEGERNQVYVILAAQLRGVQGAIPARHWTLI